MERDRVQQGQPLARLRRAVSSVPLDRQELAAIFAGGFVGALARAALAQIWTAGPDQWPWATFVVNMLGLGVGPTIVPLISDYILRDETQIRWALSLVIFCSGSLAALLLWVERGAFQRKIAEAAQWR